MEFSFAAPQPSEQLSDMANAAIKFAALAGRLAVEKRTRVYDIDGRNENVAGHSNMVAIVAPALADEFFPELSADRIARLSAIHDAIEAYVGDTPTDQISDEGFIQKDLLEQAGLKQLRVEFSEYPNTLKVIEEYEAQESPEARFVRIIDKIMPLLAHINDGGSGLQNDNATPDYVRKNSKARTIKYSSEFPDFMSIVELRSELAEYVASGLEG